MKTLRKPVFCKKKFCRVVSIAVQSKHSEKKISKIPVAEFKEFERRFKFKSRFKYGWFHLKLYQMFQNLSRR